MGFRLSNITTKTGDKGFTRLGDGSQISKGSKRINAIGGIDELNTAIGVLRAYITDMYFANNLITIQHQLLVAGSQLAGKQGSEVLERHITFLEAWMAELISKLDPVQDFVLPGGTVAGAHCHVARVTCRRTERSVVSADLDTSFAEMPIRYLNRLSDVLFVLARVLNKQENISEIVLNRQI